MLLGAHCSTAGGVWTALDRGGKAGCECVQIFVKNNMRWAGRLYSAPEIKRFKQARTAIGARAVFGHTGYLINIAAPESANREQSLLSLALEVQLAASLGLPFLVLHPGSHLGAGEERGLRRAASGLDEVFASTKATRVRIALENTAGQGACLGAKLEHLARIIELSKYPGRLGICLDTAHLFAAGFQINNRREWDKVIRRADALVGLRRVLAFHLNDSKSALGSRVDRHSHIGAGAIGIEGFRHIVNDPRFKKTPACIETPKSEDLHEDKENLARLRSLLHK